MRRTLAIPWVELARYKRLQCVRIRNIFPSLLVGERAERCKLVAASLADGGGQLALVIAEVQERLSGGVLLAHEQHRYLWRQQQDREAGAQLFRRRQLCQAI